MPTTKTWPGGGTNTTTATYSIPADGEENWSSLSDFLNALGDSAQATTFQKFATRKATTTPITVSSSTDCVIAVQMAVPAAVVVNLPAGANKQIVIIADITGDAATHNIGIQGQGGNTINGSATVTLSHNGEAIMLAYSATDADWKIISRSVPAGSLTFSDITGTLGANRGGTGIANNIASTLTISGSFATTLTISNTTSLTLPTTGTLATLAGSETLSNKTLVAPALGTPVSGVLTNCTGLVLTSGVTGTLPVGNGGTGVTSSTGSGNNVLSTSPTLVTPILGTPTSGTLTNCTGLPLTSGITGTLAIGNGGSGQNTANTALNAFLPSQTSNSGKALVTDGTNTSWTGVASVTAAGLVYSDGSAYQRLTFTSNGNKVLGIDSGGTTAELKSFAVGTSGSDFAVANGVGTITFNLPDASASNRGVVTTGTQTLAGAKTFSSTTTVTAIKGSTSETDITASTSDGSDNSSTYICGGGAEGRTRGGEIGLFGNEFASAGGRVIIQPGDSSTASGSNKALILQTSATTGAASSEVFSVKGDGTATATAAWTFSGGTIYAGGGSTLNYYDENTYTPTITPASGTGTFVTTTTFGLYTRIGRVCYFHAVLAWSDTTNTAGSPGAVIQISLPFTAKTLSSYNAICTVSTNNINLPASTTWAYGLIQSNTNKVFIQASGSGVNNANVIFNSNNSTANREIDVSGFFMI